nr:PrgI family protein [Candidatus Saccharibacteria bacterium]
MATYKVLQDIEAEDKLLGPLTLKQFIFLAITLGIGYMQFILLTNSSLGVFKWPFVLVLLPPMLVFGFLAAPISREQSNDIWLLARLRFLLKPHQRIWNQDGISQLVTITVPKHIEHIFTNGLNQNEVKSRLQALANTVDSRGWAIK